MKYFLTTIVVILFLGVNSLEELKRSNEEIIAAGRLFKIGTPVKTWMDQHGYDAYRTECRFCKWEESDYRIFTRNMEPKPNPSRYLMRHVSPDLIPELRGGGWNLTTLQKYVKKFVLHYDVAGYSKNCFRVLHDHRFLSVHFMVDVDGMLYQTVDLKERTHHATITNTDSIGIEIANIGAYPINGNNPFSKWYRKDETGKMRLVLPKGALRNENFVGRPIRNDPVVGMTQGSRLVQYDLTKQQYATLIKLTAALTKLFPRIKLDYPKENGKLRTTKLPDADILKYEGLMGHFHISKTKVDPGPAFQWDLLINGVKKLNEKNKK
eukprot:gene5959-9958_t